MVKAKVAFEGATRDRLIDSCDPLDLIMWRLDRRHDCHDCGDGRRNVIGPD